MTKIAIVYDRLNTAHGGAERVLQNLLRLYPQATCFTALHDSKQAGWTKNWSVKTSFLQYLPGSKHLHRYLAPLMPLAFEQLDLSAYEIIISVTSAEAKGVLTRRDQLHLCYLLSPPRYLYHYRQEYLNKHPLLRLPGFRHLAQASLNYLQHWDQQAISRPDIIVPIAQTVARRAAQYYPTIKLAPVLYPPVATTLLKIKPTLPKLKNYYLVVARLVPYKNVDAAILACQALGEQLVIIGQGPELSRLKAIAKPQLTHFFHNVNDAKLAGFYRQAKAVLSPGLDDFGLAALEANLFGKPVIINQLAGAAELIQAGKHGLHLNYQLGDPTEVIVQHLQQAIRQLKSHPFKAKQLEQNARKYDTTKFVRQFDKVIQQAYQAKLESQL